MTVFYPPYHNSFGNTLNTNTGDGSFSVYLNHHEDRNTGLVSTNNHNEIMDPGERAVQETTVYSGMQFSIKMPSSGRLKVVTNLVAQGYGLLHQGWMDAELLGGSSASVVQGANYYMYISDRENEFVQNFIFYRRGDDDGVWDAKLAYEGDVRQYTFVSQASFNTGDWILLNAYIDNYQWGRMNDMDFIGKMYSSWYISQIDVTAV